MNRFEIFLRRVVRVFEKQFAKRDMSWHQVAKAADIHPHTLQRLMSGETQQPRMSTIWKIARAVGMEVEFAHAISGRRVA